MRTDQEWDVYHLIDILESLASVKNLNLSLSVLLRNPFGDVLYLGYRDIFEEACQIIANRLSPTIDKLVIHDNSDEIGSELNIIKKKMIAPFLVRTNDIGDEYALKEMSESDDSEVEEMEEEDDADGRAEEPPPRRSTRLGSLPRKNYNEKALQKF